MSLDGMNKLRAILGYLSDMGLVQSLHRLCDFVVCVCVKLDDLIHMKKGKLRCHIQEKKLLRECSSTQIL